MINFQLKYFIFKIEIFILLWLVMCLHRNISGFQIGFQDFQKTALKFYTALEVRVLAGISNLFNLRDTFNESRILKFLK